MGRRNVDVNGTDICEFNFVLSYFCCSLFPNYTDPLEIKQKFWFEKNQFYVMIMKSALEKDEYIIKMDFRAWLIDDLAGLYKSSYKRKNGEEVYVT